ncbi:MAG: zinc ribbon domain-containing protein [Clostridia bacterium]|nr:zinc ribbon domain-containing protein [Clostridia bacterium]
MFCTKCGTQVPDGSNFCPNCATPVVRDNSVNYSSQNAYNPDLAPPPSYSATSYNAGSTGNGNKPVAPAIDVGAEIKKYYGVLIIPIAFFVLTLIFNTILRHVSYYSAIYDIVSWASTIIYAIMLGGLVVATKSCTKVIKFFYAIPYALIMLLSFVRYINIYNFLNTVFNIGLLAVIMVVVTALKDVKITNNNVMADIAILGAISGVVAVIYEWITGLIVDTLAIGSFYFFFPSIIYIIVLIAGAALGAFLNYFLFINTVK